MWYIYNTWSISNIYEMQQSHMHFLSSTDTSTRGKKSMQVEIIQFMVVEEGVLLVTTTGYFWAFLTNFVRAACPRSRPHTSARRTKYNKTSESSSSNLSLSSELQLGNPFATSPFHWNISDSSPTSPTCTIKVVQNVL